MKEPNPGIEALRKLASMGYRFTVRGETIKAKYYGIGNPDPRLVRPLIALIKDNKMLVMDYLTGRHEALTCNNCPWCADNPWSLYPDLPKWCGYWWDYLLAANPQCRDRLEGRVPPPGFLQDDHLKGPIPAKLSGHKGLPFTCFNCGLFRSAPNSPNSAQAWGYCQRLGKGRYGVARACDGFIASNE